MRSIFANKLVRSTHHDMISKLTGLKDIFRLISRLT